MPAVPIRISSPEIDLAARFQGTSTVVASPTDNTETIIASLTLADFGSISVVSGIRLHGWAAFTIGTSGTAANLKIRETDASGTTVAATGAVNVGVYAATQLTALDVLGFDAAPGVIKYVLTLTVTGGAAASTVSALHLSAAVI
jgi:hypothetical protein